MSIIIIERQDNLVIPSNIKLKNEIFDGFGTGELMQALLIFAVSAGSIIIHFIFSGNETALMIGLLIAIAVSVGITVKDSVTNLSVVDYIRIMARFIYSQKIYKFECRGGYKDG